MDNLASYPALNDMVPTGEERSMKAGPGDHEILEKKVKNPGLQVSLPIREY